MNERILPPPEPAGPSGAADDWSNLASPLSAMGVSSDEHVAGGGAESDGSGLRRQPELDSPAAVSAPPANEFEIDAHDEADDLAANSNRMARIVRGVARQVALDPGDGMEL